MAKSKIEWTDESWNPVGGCSLVSPGGTNCYAMSAAARIEAMSAGSARRHRAALFGEGADAARIQG